MYVGLRADWHLDQALDSPLEEFDPFESAQSTAMFMPGGKPINLDTPEPELRSRLQSLISWEGRLDARGITCPLKDLPDASCLACPVNHADDLEHPMCPLCRCGSSQERVAATLVAKRVFANDQGDGC